MKRTLLFLMALIMSAGFTFAANVDLSNPDVLSQGLTQSWNGATYDAATKTISFPGAWAGMGWDFWTSDAIPWTTLTIEFEPVDYDVLLTCQYKDGTTDQAKVAGGAGDGTISLTIQSKAVNMIVLQNSVAGTLTLKSAMLSNDSGGTTTTNLVIDFELDAVGTAYPVIAWNPTDITATVESNPAGDGNSLHIINNNWNSYPLFSVTLPEGKTIADIDSISFDLYFESVETVGGQTPNDYKSFNYFFGTKGTSFGPGAPTGSANNIVGGKADNPGQTWLHKEFAPAVSDSILSLSLNQFDFGFGMGINNAGNYYLDNITFVLKNGMGIIPVNLAVSNVYNTDGGLIVNGNNETVSIYAINGRLVKQTIANQGTNISLQQGLYVVKVGVNKAVKVVVK